METSVDKNLPRYHEYDPEQRQEPYKKKLMYLNNVFQTNVETLEPSLIEHLDGNVGRLQRYQRVFVDKHNNGNAVITTQCRSDKINPRQQLEMVRDVFAVLKLPDVVPDRLDVTSVAVNRAELISNIKNMLAQPQQLNKYQALLKHFTDIFPEIKFFRPGRLTLKHIIEKIKLIYKGFGGKLQSDNKINSRRGDYTLYYPVWPQSDFVDNTAWLNDVISDEGFGGSDITATDKHTAMLRFHVWTVNGWFSRYDEEVHCDL